tara:strand:+ start:366 stop:530 length:165 start_codon:yes stop_codon:yes gene_type:complete
MMFFKGMVEAILLIVVLTMMSTVSGYTFNIADQIVTVMDTRSSTNDGIDKLSTI